MLLGLFSWVRGSQSLRIARFYCPIRLLTLLGIYDYDIHRLWGYHTQKSHRNRLYSLHPISVLPPIRLLDQFHLEYHPGTEC